MDQHTFHLQDGAYALSVRKGKPDLATRKRLASIDDVDVVRCVGCHRNVRTWDDGGTVDGFVAAVAECDRPNGAEFAGRITVTDDDGNVVKAPYSEATVPVCPACNGSGMRDRHLDRIIAAHEDRIRTVGRRL